MHTLYPIIVDAVHQDRTVVLATLIKRTGSTPRDAGTRFVVFEDGTSRGTIGGGLLEAHVIEEAQRVMKIGKPVRFEFRLTGTDVADSDMLCGGEGEVFLEPVSPRNPEQVRIFERVLKVLDRGGSGLVVSSVDPDRWSGAGTPKAFVDAEGEVTGSLLGVEEMPATLVEIILDRLGREQAHTAVLEDETRGPLEVLVEPVVSTPVLYLFGGGHVAGEIVPIAARVGFEVVVIDDRPEFADPARFPEAREVKRAPFEGLLEQLPVDSSSYLVIVTRGHIHDKTVLEQALRSEARYVGMIGSSRKIRIIYDRLQEEGFEREQMDRVHAPIGLDIGAETPEEIAVSIVAELILVRAGGGKRKRRAG
ncbi:MAG: XdhC family protein [Deltaproteobacteria bacterium]|nr:XdhC family protein [Deltaproteobacteria bacterium]